MGHLSKIRKQFITILAALGVINLLVIIYLFLPGSSPSALAAKEKSLQEQANALSREVAPLKGIDVQLGKTRKDVKHFYDEKVPNQFSQISQQLEKLMKDAGVSAQGIHYTEERNDQKDKNDLPDVHRVGIDTTVSGEYSKVAHFINALEQDKFVFVINQISLSSQESGVISLQIKCETFLTGS
jgi:Tfp pilus assembly protein PilO